MLESMITENGRMLLCNLRQIPPNFQRIKDELDSGGYSAENVSMAALQFVADCSSECIEMSYQNRKVHDSIDVSGFHSTYVCDIICLLLNYGLNPNAIFENYNIMQELKHINNEYLGADALALLLEHGGDANLMIDGETLFSSVDFDVIFDAFNQEDRSRFDALVHFWFVLLGYGAAPENGTSPIDTFDDFDIRNLKNHREYTFGLSRIPCRGENWSLHIFDRNTLWEVARL
ncbi:MAG: hypothetical protein QMB62_11430 [Oscillospiraceae bacterium]